MTLSKKWAFLIHLNLSILVFATLVVTMWFYWFPGDLFFLDGGWQGLKLVAIIDLVLGPALTLLLYKPGKKGLVFDMAAIALFQLSALAYGFYTTWQQQTFALVYSEGTFNTVSMAAHKTANKELISLGEQPKQARSIDANRPSNIFIEPPNEENYGKYLEDIFNGYPDPQERSDRYDQIASNYDTMKQRKLTIDELRDSGQWAAVEKKLQSTKTDLQDVDLYRFKARYANGVAVFSPEKMRIVDYIRLENPKRSETDVRADAEDIESQ